MAKTNIPTTLKDLVSSYQNKNEEWLKHLDEAGGSEEIPEIEPFVLTDGVTEEVFEKFIDEIEEKRLIRSYMRLESGKVLIYECPCIEHDAPSRYFCGFVLGPYITQKNSAFRALGSSKFLINGSMKEADESLRHNHFNTSALKDCPPALVVEIGWSQTLKDLDRSAQIWLKSPNVYGVLIFKIYKRRVDPLTGLHTGPFAMFGAFYEQGRGERADGGIAPAWATEFGTVATMADCIPSYLGTPITGPFSGGEALVAGIYVKRIPGAILYGGVPGGVPVGAHEGGDLVFDLFDLQENFSSTLL